MYGITKSKRVKPIESHDYSKLYTKQEGLGRVAEDLCEEYGIERNPIPETGAKWKAALGIFRMPMLNGPAAAVAACLIDHADEATGIAWPSEPTIAKWTGRPKRTVQRAIAALRRLGLVQIARRHNQSSIYSILWPSFLSAFAKGRVKSGATIAPKVAQPASKVASYSSYLSSLENLVVQAAENAARTTLNEEEKKEAFKEERVVSLRPIPQTTEREESEE